MQPGSGTASGFRNTSRSPALWAAPRLAPPPNPRFTGDNTSCTSLQVAVAEATASALEALSITTISSIAGSRRSASTQRTRFSGSL